MNWYTPETRLDTLLDIVIDSYEHDREEYWSDDEKTVRIREFADRVAHIVVESSEDTVLRMPDRYSDISWTELQEFVRELELSDEVRAKVEIIVAKRYATENRRIASRCLELAELLLASAPSERVLRFLRRLGRCYVAGLFPETIMVCRGVFENAVNETLARRKLLNLDKMSKKLDCLLHEKVLTPDQGRKAWTIWNRGNTAIHNDPEAVGHALETVVITLEVLSALQSGSDSPDVQ